MKTIKAWLLWRKDGRPVGQMSIEDLSQHSRKSDERSRLCLKIKEDSMDDYPNKQEVSFVCIGGAVNIKKVCVNMKDCQGCICER